jgi:hypothetical protein
MKCCLLSVSGVCTEFHSTYQNNFPTMCSLMLVSSWLYQESKQLLAFLLLLGSHRCLHPWQVSQLLTAFLLSGKRPSWRSCCFWRFCNGYGTSQAGAQLLLLLLAFLFLTSLPLVTSLAVVPSIAGVPTFAYVPGKRL